MQARYTIIIITCLLDTEGDEGGGEILPIRRLGDIQVTQWQQY